MATTKENSEVQPKSSFSNFELPSRLMFPETKEVIVKDDTAFEILDAPKSEAFPDPWLFYYDIDKAFQSACYPSQSNFQESCLIVRKYLYEYYFRAHFATRPTFLNHSDIRDTFDRIPSLYAIYPHIPRYANTTFDGEMLKFEKFNVMTQMTFYYKMEHKAKFDKSKLPNYRERIRKIHYHSFSTYQGLNALVSHSLFTYKKGVFCLETKTLVPKLGYQTIHKEGKYIFEPDIHEGFIKCVAQFGGLVPGLDKLGDASDNFSDLVDTIRTTILPDLQDMTGNGNDVIDKLSNILSDVNLKGMQRNAVDEINKMTDKVFDRFDVGFRKIVATVILASSIVMVKFQNDTRSYIALGISLAAFVVVWYDDLSAALSTMASMFNVVRGKYAIVPQSGDVINNVAVGLLTCLSSASVGMGKPMDIPKNILHSLSNLDRTKTGLIEIFTVFMDFIKTLGEYVVGGEHLPSCMKFVTVNDATMRETFLRLENMITKFNTKELMLSRENYDSLKIIRRQIETYLKETPRTNSTSGLLTIINDQRKVVLSLLKKFETTFKDNIRQEPVVVCFRGGPGIAKSQTLQHLASAAVIATVSDVLLDHATKHPDQFIYNRNAANIYWDGYHPNALVTLMDDFGQYKDVAGNPDSEAASMIAMVNELEAQLHVAGIEEKGNTPFISKFVFLTTNAIDLNFNSVISSEAVKRRLEFTYTAVPKEQYRLVPNADMMGYRLDKTKLPLGIKGVTSLHPDCLEFYEYDYLIGDHTGQKFTFDQVVQRALEREKLKRVWFEQKEIELQDTVSKYLDQRKQMLLDRELKRSEIQMEDVISTSPQNGKTVTRTDMVELLSSWANVQFIFKTLYGEDAEGRYKALFDPFDHKKGPPFKNIIKVFDSLSEEIRSTYCGPFILSCILSMEHLDLYSSKEPTGEQLFTAAVVFYEVSALKLTKPILPDVSLTGKFKAYCSYYNDKIKQTWSSFQAALISAYKYIKENALAITTIISLVSLCAILVRTFAFDKKKMFMVTEVGPQKGDYHQRAPKNSTPRGHVVKQMEEIKPQMGIVADPSGCEQVDSIVKSNMYHMSLIAPTGSTALGFVTFISGKIMMVNDHFVSVIERKDDGYVLIQKQDRNAISNTIKMSCKDFLQNCWQTQEAMDRDLCFVYVRSAQLHSNITHIFPTKDDAQNLKSKDCRLINRKGGNTTTHVSEMGTRANITAETDEISFDVCGAYQYRGMTQEGDCGTWLQILDHSMKPKVWGIHVAGNTTTYIGYSTPVFREDLDKAISHFGNEHNPLKVVPQTGLFQEKFEIRRILDDPLITVSKSSLVRTPVYGAWSVPMYKPMKLKPFTNDIGEYVDPYAVNIKEYCLEDVPIDPQVFDAIRANIASHLVFVSDDFNYTPISFEEAILGIDGDPFFDSISRKTSAGYPLNKTCPGKGKEYWFGDGAEYDMDNDRVKELKLQVEDTIARMINGERIEFIFADNLKDQVAKKEKVEKGKGRIFNSCPLVYFIIWRMFYGSFSSWFVRNCIKNGSALGVNCYSSQWSEIAHHLQRFGNKTNVGAGDYKKFDGSQRVAILNVVFDIIETILDDTMFKKIRWLLWQEVTHSVHLRYDTVYEWFGSLPSGHPFTTIINIIYNHVAFNYCFYRALGDNISCIFEFYDMVYLICMGDDNLFSVNPLVISVFNEMTLPDFMAEIGLTYTSELKETAVVALRDITDVSFLKRKFRKCFFLRRFVAPLELEVILNSAYWINKGPTVDTSIEQNIQWCVDELALHGEEIFDLYVKQIVKGCKNRRFQIPKNTYFPEVITRVSLKMECF